MSMIYKFLLGKDLLENFEGVLNEVKLYYCCFV